MSRKVSIKDFFVAQLYFTIFLRASAPSAANNPDGFLSIDCGNTEGQYTDPQTSLMWVDDGSYVQLGYNGNISQSIPSYLENYKDMNYRALTTFRYFETKLQKYCYELPTPMEKTSFLIRAIFLHGNASILNDRLRFQVYINNARWIQVQYGFENEYDFNVTEPVVREGMFTSSGNSRKINVCFIPNIGTPFISSLESRKLDSEGTIYPDALVDTYRWVKENLFFSKLMRWNVGQANASLVRYPNDTYDRFWDPSPFDYSFWDPDPSDYSNSFSISSNNQLEDFSVINDSKISPKESNSLPYEVMKDSWTIGGAEVVSISVNNSRLLLASGSSVYLMVYVYSYESNLESSLASLYVNLGGNSQNVNIPNHISIQSIGDVIHGNSTDITIECNSGSFDLLALELYSAARFTAGTNDYEDGVAQFLRRTFNILDWQGDPCIPTPYNGITCSSSDNYDYDYSQEYFSFQSLTLSYLNNSSLLMATPTNISNLLQLLNLSITNSNIDDNIVIYLWTEFTNGPLLQFVNLSYNNIRDFFNTTQWEEYYDAYAYSSQAILDVSHNDLTKLPQRTDLEVLYGEQTTLQNLDISNNNIAGEFQGSLFEYFLDSSVFEKLYANNNRISGRLNLTSWYQKLRASFQNSVTINQSDPVFHQLFSFVNNDIFDIIPDLETFESTLDINSSVSLFIKYEAGILLGGTPYCQSETTSFHSFLCRLSIHDDYEFHAKEKSNTPIIVGVSVPGGVLVLLSGFISLLIIWTLRKKVVTLQEFQQELHKRNVKPPLFSYHELQIATEYFHIDNKLGEGGFGVVYKGVLQNKTVAVKKLFNSSQQAQVLSDFLTEVVLLTGIKHKNLVQLLGCSINVNERILVYEFAERGNVGDALWGICNSPNSHNSDHFPFVSSF